MNDEYYIATALKLALKGKGKTAPNPMVGAVLVKNNKIIGTGYHKKFGDEHAEVRAIKNSKVNPKGSTLYLSLEPCSHFGKTPPCTDLIIDKGISNVICSSLDPDPRVNGQGIRKLRGAGIDVEVGLLKDKAKILNEQYFMHHQNQRPFITLKFASSLDGKLATHAGDSKWITNEKSRNYSRKLRGEYQSILAGINTILEDNPHLGTDLKNGHDPLRIILDSKLRIPLEANVLRNNNVLIITTQLADQKKLSTLKKLHVKVIKLPSKKIDLKVLMEELYHRKINSVLVEGGGKILGSFVDEKLVDKVYAFHAPIIIGGKNAPSAVMGKGSDKISNSLKLKDIKRKTFENDILTIGYAY